MKAFEDIKEIIRKTPPSVLIIIGCLVLGIIAISVSKSSTPYQYHNAQAPHKIICPACGGAGQVERPVAPDSPLYMNQICGICGGTGRITPPPE